MELFRRRHPLELERGATVHVAPRNVTVFVRLLCDHPAMPKQRQTTIHDDNRVQKAKGLGRENSRHERRVLVLDKHSLRGVRHIKDEDPWASELGRHTADIVRQGRKVAADQVEARVEKAHSRVLLAMTNDA